MNKRWLLAGLAALPFIGAAQAAPNRNSATWRVPPGIKKIRVRSWNPNGKANLDRTLNVKPGEFFRIDAIEE
jgi:hypothetical protein